MAKELREGLKAPAFTMPTDGEGKASLKDYAGRKLVLYFYPKDDTSGCTKQAIAFSGMQDDFDAAGADILGVSADPVSKHDKFKAKHELTIPLASDEDHAVLEKYGVWVEKSMYGKKYMGIERSTFLIDAEGRIARIWRKVKVPGHVEEVLNAARELG
ncbi:MAG: thioredoxin-dependent thiol peroxidase [Pseudomonadota bacterium]